MNRAGRRINRNGRFAKYFDKDSNSSETLLKAKQERLEN